MFKEVTIQVPGKLFIAGEYGVTRPNGKALVAAIETPFFVSVKERSGLSKFHTNVGLEDFEFDVNHFEVPNHSWNFATQALKNCIELIQSEKIDQFSELKHPLPQLLISIESDLGFGENKKGYGSSASVVVGVTQAVNQFLDGKIPEDLQFEAAAKAHREVQKSGSMGDVASITTHGVIFYQAPDEHFKNWKIETQEWKKNNWSTYIVRTGKSVKTAEKLTLSLPESFFEKSDQLVEKIAALKLKNCPPNRRFSVFKQLILENQQLLITHLPQGYVTEKLAFALTLINEKSNLVGKISGAGFGENMIVFAKNEKEINEIKEKLEQNDIILEKIRILDEER